MENSLKNSTFTSIVPKTTTILFGLDEFSKITISNQISNIIKSSLITYNTFEETIEYLTQNKADLIILDIDNLDNEAINRFYKIINHLEIPSLITSSDSGFLNKLRLEMETNLISFLPKSILNSMFAETVSLLLKKNSPGQKITKRIIKTSALPKSKSLYLLAALLFCEPLIKVMYLKFSTGFEWEILMRTIFSIEGFIKNFEFWGIFPLAGYALLSVKSWSFFFFIGLQAYGLYAFMAYEKFTWPYVAQSPHVSSTLLLFLNLGLMTYLLIPAHLRPYWNASRRIWRNTTRFGTNLHTFFKYKNNAINTTITNISETGAYFTSHEQLNIGDAITLEIPLNGKPKTIEAIVRRSQQTAHDDFFGYGIEFNYKNKTDKLEVKEFVGTLTQRIQ